MKEINLIEPVYTEHLFRQVLLVLPLPVYTEHLFYLWQTVGVLSSVKSVTTCIFGLP
jgi:hypothetical protein